VAWQEGLRTGTEYEPSPGYCGRTCARSAERHSRDDLPSASSQPTKRSVRAGREETIAGDDRELIHQKTHALNQATQHLAEVVMNRTVRAALSGKNVDDVG